MIPEIRPSNAQNPTPLSPGKTVKGKTLCQIDKTHYLISINGKKMIAFSERPLKEGEPINAFIKGNYPRLFLKINTTVNNLANNAAEEIPVSLKDQLFQSLINDLLADLPNINKKNVENIISFFKNQNSMADFLNKFPRESAGIMKVLKDSPLLLNNLLEKPIPFSFKNFGEEIYKLIKLLKTLPQNEETLGETKGPIKEIFSQLIGNQVYNYKNKNQFFFFPFLFRHEDNWYQFTGSLKKNKNGKKANYLKIFMDFTFSGPLEILFRLEEDARLILKIKSNNNDFLDLLEEYKDELKQSLRQINVNLLQLTTEHTMENIESNFFFSGKKETSVVDFQV